MIGGTVEENCRRERNPWLEESLPVNPAEKAVRTKFAQREPVWRGHSCPRNLGVRGRQRVPRASPGRVRTPARHQQNLLHRKPAKVKGYNPVAPERVAEILKRLNDLYPAVTCALTHNSAWELLVATILSAQSTDVNVNRVTPELFRKYPTVQAFAALTPEQLEPSVRSTGFFRNKSKSVVGAAKMIVADFGGEVPEDIDKLLRLPGVARKTANVVLGTWFKKAEGVVVDTHVHRISRRLELTKENDPPKIEQDLMKIIPRERWILFSHQIIWHGRGICYRAQASMRRVPAGKYLPRRRQDLEHGGNAQGCDGVRAVSGLGS